MQRNDNWAEALEKVFLEQAQTPFQYGRHDCLLAVSNALHAMTGVDPAVDFRGQYDSEHGFMRMLAERKCKSLEHLVTILTAEHGLKEIGVRLAQRGDVVLFDTETGPAFGVVHHNGIHAVSTGTEGLRRLRTLDARRAWRVG